MGNNQSYDFRTDVKREISDKQSEPNILSESSILNVNPLHIYTRYKSSMPIKTLSSIISQKNNAEPIAITVNKSEKHKKPHIIVKQPIDSESDLSSDQNSLNNQMLLKPKGMTSSLNAKGDLNNFPALTIKMQTFINLKQQPVQNSYQIKQCIGQGSFGKVFRAICKITQEQRAIKMIKSKFLKDNKKKQFMAQMSILSKLNHPSIITLYDLFFYNSKYFVVMEYCKGGAVVDMIHLCKKKSQKIIAAIMKQLFSALSYMHSLNIIHRDIKLDNLVFLHPISQDESDEEYIPIKIIDFGSAVESKVKVVQNYAIAGTLSYLAPEAMRGTLTDKSDLWSCGVMLIILLTGKSPFRGKTEKETKDNINNKKINFKQAIYRQISQQAKDLISQLLQHNFYKRSSAGDALRHSWFENPHKSSQHLTNLQQLERYHKGNNLISVIESFLSLKKVTQCERQKLAEVFNEIDSDGNGVIEISQLVDAYKKMFGSKISEDQIRKIAEDIDKNKSGKIDFHQFVVGMTSKQKLFVKESLSQAFSFFDKDKTGYIQISELRELLKGCAAEEVEYFINELDTDQDEKISQVQFIEYFLKM